MTVLEFGRVRGNDLLRSVAMALPNVLPVKSRQLIASQTPDLSQVRGLSFINVASRFEVLTKSWGGHYGDSVSPERVVCGSTRLRHLASTRHVTWPTSQFCPRHQASTQSGKRHDHGIMTDDCGDEDCRCLPFVDVGLKQDRCHDAEHDGDPGDALRAKSALVTAA